MIYPWLQTIYDRTIAEIRVQGIHHALLFQGPQGIGKRDLIASLTAWWLCEAPQAAVACGDCRGCHLWRTGNHPDVYSLEPDGVQFTIKVNHVRELIDFALQSPSIAKHKLVLIPYAHRMNTNAANALLKILEEPPQHTYFLLESCAPGVLPKTVISRTAQITCRPPSADQAYSWLQSFVAEAALPALFILAGTAPLCIKAWVDRAEVTAILEAINHLNAWVAQQRSIWEVAELLQNLPTDVARRLVYQLLFEMLAQQSGTATPRLYQLPSKVSLSAVEAAAQHWLEVAMAEAHHMNLNPLLAWEAGFARHCIHNN